MRGRPGRKGPNPLTRSFESNGPDVKIRGTAQHVAEKYLQLARDAQSSGDIVLAENLLQHAEHYFRLIAAAQQQQNGGYGRSSYEQEAELEDDDDFTGVPDRFAPLSERLPLARFFRAAAEFPAAGQLRECAAAELPAAATAAAAIRGAARPIRKCGMSARCVMTAFNSAAAIATAIRSRTPKAVNAVSPERGDRPERGERQPRFGFDRNRERPRFEQRPRP